MSSVFVFCEDNGASAGDPTQGTTRTSGVTNCNWKNIDNTTSIYSNHPIVAGTNSYTKYQFGFFSGTFNQISDVRFQHVSGTLANGLSVAFSSSTGYVTPSTTTLVSGFLTSTGNITSGMPIWLGTEPQKANLSGITSGGFTSYFITQLQSTLSVSPGDTTTCTFQVQYTES